MIFFSRNSKDNRIRRITDLFKHKGSIYVWMANERVCKEFFAKAEEEGFTFGKGVKITEKETSDIFHVNRDKSLSYVGFCGHLAWNGQIKAKDMVKIDYERYMNGEKDYMYKKPKYIN